MQMRLTGLRIIWIIFALVHIPFEIGDKRTYSENQPFIGWEELNRIESACLKMYLNIQSGMDSRPTLEMTLGGDVNTWL